MKIVPKTEDQLKREWPLLPDGDYPFTVLASLEQASKSEKNKGKMMFGVKLNVHGKDGDYHVYDYFADWFSEWKLKHFADTTGQSKNYQAGEMNGANDGFAGKVGWVKIGAEPASGNFKAKNVVVDYVVREQAPVSQPPVDDTDVPFN